MVAKRSDNPESGVSKTAQYSQCRSRMYMNFRKNDSIFHFSGSAANG